MKRIARGMVGVLVTVGIALLALAEFGVADANDAKHTNATDPSVRLRELQDGDIESMQVFRLEQDGREAKRRFVQAPLERQARKGILSLVREVSRRDPASRGGVESYHPPDHVMVVRTVNGDSLEITYNAKLKAPFGQFVSRPLKEALYALVAPSRGCAIHVVEGKVGDVVLFHTLVAGEGRIRRQEWAASVNLNEKGELFLDLQTYKNGRVVIQDRKRMEYGEARVFDHNGDGYMIVHLYLP